MVWADPTETPLRVRTTHGQEIAMPLNLNIPPNPTPIFFVISHGVVKGHEIGHERVSEVVFYFISDHLSLWKDLILPIDYLRPGIDALS